LKRARSALTRARRGLRRVLDHDERDHVAPSLFRAAARVADAGVLCADVANNARVSFVNAGEHDNAQTASDVSERGHDVAAAVVAAVLRVLCVDDVNDGADVLATFGVLDDDHDGNGR